MLSDEQWAELEPLTEACRPYAKVPSPHLHRIVEAILWRHQRERSGVLFLPSLAHGGWRHRPPSAVRGLASGRGFPRWLEEWDARLSMAFQDGTDFRAHQRRQAPSESGFCKQRDSRKGLGRSRGGFGTKACVTADGAGGAFVCGLAPGQHDELPHAIPPLRHEAPSPTRTTSSTTTVGSNACGLDWRDGTPSPPGRRRPRPASLESSVWRSPRLAEPPTEVLASKRRRQTG